MRRITVITGLRGLRPASVLAATVAAAGAAVVLSAAPPSSAASSTTAVSGLQQQLSAGQQQVTQLAGTAAAAGQRVQALGSGITALQHQLAGLQGALNRRRDRLLALRGQLEAADARLGGLERVKRAAENVLAHQLVGSYEDQSPDIVDVVLESTGFNDLLDQLSFIRRVNQQDARVTAHVRSARRAVAAEARSLGGLNARAQGVAQAVLSERNQVARARLRLVVQQLAAAKAKAAATGALATAQVQVTQLTQQLETLRATQPPAASPGTRTTSGAGATSGTGAAPVHGTTPFPVPKDDAAPEATWSVGDGVAIAAPAGTPELAVCAGTVVLHGIGGLGPSTPVLRCDQPLAGHEYVYYGFAGPRKLAPIGTDVVLGQPLARVGAGTIAQLQRPASGDRIRGLQRRAARILQRLPDAVAATGRLRGLTNRYPHRRRPLSSAGRALPW